MPQLPSLFTRRLTRRGRHHLRLVLLAGLLLAGIAQSTAVLARTMQGPSGAAPNPLAARQTAADDPWARGNDLMRRGNYRGAMEYFGALASVGAGNLAVGPGALLSLVRAALAEGDPAAADSALDQLMADYPRSAERLDGLFLRGQVRRSVGDCRGALTAWLEYEANAGPAALGPYLLLQRAACYESLGEPENTISAANAALSIEDGGPRLARVEAYEKAGAAYERLGLYDQALDFYSRALEVARTRSYRAEMLYTTARLARAAGRDALGAERFRAVVVEYPEQRRASVSLGALAELGQSGTVSPYQAGLVLMNAGDYAGARALLVQVDPASTDAPAAAFNQAIARLRLGEEDAAVADLRALAEWAPPGWAGTALLRAGRVLESNGRYAEADAAYIRLQELAPGSDLVAEALVRAGLTRYLRQDAAGALAAWTAALDPASKPAPALEAQAYYWRGKALAELVGADSPEAREAWTRATSAAPATFYGLRAQDRLTGLISPLSSTAPAPLGGLQPGDAERQEWAAWLQARQLTPEALAAELAADPNLQRAERLFALALPTEAAWEIDAVVQRYTDGRDAARLGALGEWLARRDLPHLVLQLGQQELRLLGGTTASLPRTLQRQLYPAGFGDIAVEQAAANPTDPFLMLGLIRQESSFNPRAQSSARALGLTQVVPPTAAQIARALGMADSFQNSDLFKPEVSLTFGSWYLAQQLARYEGRVFPALAAYNAGAGATDGWLRQWGDDPDVFVEQIPYAETNSYVKLVYQNYRLYQRLYGG